MKCVHHILQYNYLIIVCKGRLTRRSTLLNKNLVFKFTSLFRPEFVSSLILTNSKNITFETISIQVVTVNILHKNNVIGRILFVN